MNRRTLIKSAAALPFLSSLNLSARSSNPIDTSFANYPDFYNFFHKIKLYTCKDVPSEAQFLLPSEGKEVSVLGVKPYRIEGITLTEIQHKINYDAATLFLAAGYNQNIMVSDNKKQNNILTTRLVSLLQNVVSNNGNTNRHLTDIFIRQSTKTNGLYTEMMKIYHVPNRIWDRLENYFLKDLGGNYAAGDRNLVIGMTSQGKNYSLVNPIFKNLHRTLSGKYEIEMGLASLDSSRIILGSF